MAHFAQLDENNIVIQVIVVSNNECLDENGNESEDKGIAFCQSLFGGKWVQTSYSGKIRKRYAAIDYVYDENLDAFIPPKPFNSWTLNTEIYNWVSPIPIPSDFNILTKPYLWNEETLSWDPIVQPVTTGSQNL